MRTKYLSFAAIIILAGMLTSGPAGSYIIQLLSPEPPWVNAETYIAHYSPLQSIPFYFGFILMFGFILFFASLPAPSSENDHILVRLTLLFAGLYTFMISLNYLIQIALVPNVLNYPGVIELLAVLNAKSLFWYIEMTGYGFLGLATWTAGLMFRGSRGNEIIRWLCVANGIISILGSILTFLFKGWVLTLPGMFSYILWNILIMILAIVILTEFKFGKTEVRVTS